MKEAGTTAGHANAAAIDLILDNQQFRNHACWYIFDINDA